VGFEGLITNLRNEPEHRRKLRAFRFARRGNKDFLLLEGKVRMRTGSFSSTIFEFIGRRSPGG
jgi:hypothetical protein